MLDAAILGFWSTIAWPAFGYMLLGIAIGFWVGLLPGLGGLATLALMLPFSYNIKDPVSAFAFLLGMLAVTGTTGDLTSILFGIPGEGSWSVPEGAVTTKDGGSGWKPGNYAPFLSSEGWSAMRRGPTMTSHWRLYAARPLV